MTSERLTAVLAEQVMKWRLAPERFLTGPRQWIPRYRFRPLSNVDDALKLVNAAGASLELRSKPGCPVEARVVFRGRKSRVTLNEAAAAITTALVEVLDFKLDNFQHQGLEKVGGNQ